MEKTLNPVWDETVWLPFYDKNDVLKLKVKSHYKSGTRDDQSIGSVKIKLDILKNFEYQVITFPLTGMILALHI